MALLRDSTQLVSLVWEGVVRRRGREHGVVWGCACGDLLVQGEPGALVGAYGGDGVEPVLVG